MENKFIVGVADVRAYDNLDNLIFRSKTMLTTSMEISTGSTEIAGGKRNKLLNVYYHSGRLNLTLEDTVWNMEWIKQNVNSQGISVTPEIPYKLSVAVVAGINTLPSGSPTPVPFDGSAVAKIYTVDSDGNTLSYALTTAAGVSTFTVGASDTIVGQTVCMEYYINDANVTSITVPASIVPARVRAVLDVDVSSNKAGDGIVGRTIIEVPSLQLSGAQTINMTSNGYSTVPLSGMALAFTPSTATNPCMNQDIYAIISTQLYNTHWYDSVNGLAVLQGDFSITPEATYQLQIVGTAPTGTVPVNMTDLTFTVTGDAADSITVSTTGLVTALNSATAGQTADIKVVITAKPAIEAHVVCTIA